TMTVVLGPGWPGVLLHEAIGHGLEGDFNRKRVSAFTDRVGTRVASEMCTVVDDGTIAERRGSLNVDDEGTPTQRTVLIERGILRGYLQDRLNAAAMRMTPTGNGRRESFAHLPMPRMTNTFMLAGEDAPEDVIRSVDRGLYAVYFGGGQVDITSGKFVFSASEAYLIEGGKVTRPVRGATLIGNGPDVLTLKRSRQRRAGLRVFVGDATAIVSTADFSPEGLAALARDAVALARATAPDPHAGLPDPAELAGEQPDLDLHDPAVERLEPEQALAWARDAESAALAAAPEITNSEGAEFAADAGLVAYASSLGFVGAYAGSSVSLAVVPG